MSCGTLNADSESDVDPGGVMALVERARTGETSSAERFDALTSTTLLVTAVPMSGVATPPVRCW